VAVIRDEAKMTVHVRAGETLKIPFVICMDFVVKSLSQLITLADAVTSPYRSQGRTTVWTYAD
jgi:hypothetical protein